MLSSAERDSEYQLLPSSGCQSAQLVCQSAQLVSEILPQILLHGLPTSGAFAEVLQILPSQPPIELIALASAVKQTLERQSAEVPHYEGMCLTPTTLGKQSRCKSFPVPLLVLVLSKWLPYHPSKTMIYQFVFIYTVHYAVYYKKWRGTYYSFLGIITETLSFAAMRQLE